MQSIVFFPQHSELTALADEAQNLKDENDVLRHTADNVVSALQR